MSAAPRAGVCSRCLHDMMIRGGRRPRFCSICGAAVERWGGRFGPRRRARGADPRVAHAGAGAPSAGGDAAGTGAELGGVEHRFAPQRVTSAGDVAVLILGALSLVPGCLLNVPCAIAAIAVSGAGGRRRPDGVIVGGTIPATIGLVLAVMGLLLNLFTCRMLPRFGG